MAAAAAAVALLSCGNHHYVAIHVSSRWGPAGRRAGRAAATDRPDLYCALKGPPPPYGGRWRTPGPGPPGHY